MTDQIREAAERRAAAMAARADRPSQRRSASGLAAAVRTLDVRTAGEPVERNGLVAVRIGGYASTTEQEYEMWDMFGPYGETVRQGAFKATLATDPMVEYTRNHGAGGGLPMAHTRNDTLDLAEDDIGLGFDAYADPRRSDVNDLVLALERGDAAESSFKFSIDDGEWDEAYERFFINAVNINRGDVSTVNFGANPNASSALRHSCPECTARAAQTSARSAVRITDDDVRLRN